MVYDHLDIISNVTVKFELTVNYGTRAIQKTTFDCSRKGLGASRPFIQGYGIPEAERRVLSSAAVHSIISPESRTGEKLLPHRCEGDVGTLIVRHARVCGSPQVPYQRCD